MDDQDIRWHQRLSNYNKALAKLDAGIPQPPKGLADLSDLEKEGLIQRFEYTHELAWNLMKDYLEYQGIANIIGSRDAIREAFRAGLILAGQDWMDTIQSRNQTSHSYNEETAQAILEKIVETYHPLFQAFQQKMEAFRQGTQSDLFADIE